MKLRVLAFCFLVVSFSSPGYAIYFPGELTPSDALAEFPGAGDFYYDLYRVTVDVPMQIEVFMDPVAAFAPWIGYWDGDLSPTPNYYDPPPVISRGPRLDDVLGDQIYMIFDAQPGIEYLVMAATFEYNPTNLGTYDFFITDPGRTDTGYEVIPWSVMLPQSVPAPASWLVFGLGLVILGLVSKLVPASRLSMV